LNYTVEVVWGPESGADSWNCIRIGKAGGGYEKPDFGGVCAVRGGCSAAARDFAADK